MYKYSKKIMGIMILVIGFIISFSNVSAFSRNGDPYRIMDTNLNYAFPNGSLFMYNTSMSADTTIYNGTEVFSENGTEWGYGFNQINYEKLNSNSVNFTIKNFKNLTETPSTSIDMTEWGYSSTYTTDINKMYSSILSVNGYFPDDIFVDDMLINDDSLLEYFVDIEDMSPFHDMDMNDLIENENATIYSLVNDSSVDIKTRYEGKYNGSQTMKLTMNDPFENVNGFNITIILGIVLEIKMNCYHTMDMSNIGFYVSIYAQNNTNSSQYFDMNEKMNMRQTLISSTLPPCAIDKEPFYQNWMIGVSMLLIVSMVFITYLISLNNKTIKYCDTQIDQITKNGTVEFTLDKYDSLPSICQDKSIRKSLTNPK